MNSPNTDEESEVELTAIHATICHDDCVKKILFWQEVCFRGGRGRITRTLLSTVSTWYMSRYLHTCEMSSRKYLFLKVCLQEEDVNPLVCYALVS